MARGGRRQGAPGRAYAQRTDLNAHSLPVQVATGQGYGVAGAQAAAQQAVPLASPPTPGVGTPQGGAAVAPAPGPQPGSFGAFDRPTNRPNEPVTHGAALGPGAGPEALGLPQQPQASTLASTLRQLAAQSGSSELAQLASHAVALGGR